MGRKKTSREFHSKIIALFKEYLEFEFEKYPDLIGRSITLWTKAVDSQQKNINTGFLNLNGFLSFSSIVETVSVDISGYFDFEKMELGSESTIDLILHIRPVECEFEKTVTTVLFRLTTDEDSRTISACWGFWDAEENFEDVYGEIY